MTATLVWEFRHTPDISTPSNGRVQTLSNGNVMIDWGAATQNKSTVPIATEVSPTGELVYEMYFASYTKGARLQKYIWNRPDLVKSQSFQNIISGNIYNASNAGVAVTVSSLEGKENNGLAVKRHFDAVRFPQFTAAAPQVMIDRVTISAFGIDDITFDLNFDIQGMDFKDPNNMTVYHRLNEGKGVFTPLVTYYDNNINKLVALDAKPGEFIFAYPDIQEIASAPILKVPEDLGAISYTKPVTFEWTPKGLFQSFHLQVARDSEFNDIVVDEPNLTSFKYIMETIDPNTAYWWRVNATNAVGTSGWSSASFTAVAPKIEVISPNGGEQWQQGLTYYIQWTYNMDDDVVIELYKGSSFYKTIDTVSGTQTYEWEADLAAKAGSNYYIKVKSSEDNSIFDMSDAPFSLVH